MQQEIWRITDDNNRDIYVRINIRPAMEYCNS